MPRVYILHNVAENFRKSSVPRVSEGDERYHAVLGPHNSGADAGPGFPMVVPSLLGSFHAVLKPIIVVTSPTNFRVSIFFCNGFSSDRISACT